MFPVIPPYIIFAAYDRCSPDLHIVASQTLYLFGSPTHGLYLFLVPSNFFQSVPRTGQKTILSFDYHFIDCIAAVSQFFCGWKYQFSKTPPFWIFKFFKCVTISHPLNPGAMPWYFASVILISEGFDGSFESPLYPKV